MGKKGKSQKAGGQLGLRGQLLLWTLTIVNIAFVGIWLLSTDTAREGVAELNGENLGLSAQNLSDAVGQLIADTESDGRTTARLDLPAQAIESGDPKNITWYADELVASKGRYVAIVVSDERGKIVGANSVDRHGKKLGKRFLGRTLGKAPWWKAALGKKKGEGVWVPPQRPAFLNDTLAPEERVAGFSYPVIDIMDESIGTLTIFLSMDFVGKQLNGFVGQDARSVALVLGAGDAAVAVPGAVPERQTWRSAAWKAPASGAQGEVTAPTGNRYVAVARAVPGVTSWRLVAMKTAATLEAPVNQIGDRLLLSFAIAIMLTTLGLVAAATRFVRPLTELTKTIRSVGKASAYEPLPVTRQDEVGQLTASFNAMFGTIAAHEEQLEEKVAERTAELENARRNIKELLDNLRQGVFTIGPSGTVEGEYSAYTEVIFGDDPPVAGREAQALLQLDRQGSVSAESRMTFWLENIFGSDELQWMLAEGEALPEVRLLADDDSEGSRTRYLELEYAPLYKDDEVARVMVIAKDVTDVRELREEVVRKEQQNQTNLERVAELAGLDRELFVTFLSESRDLLETCRAAHEALEADPADASSIDALFRAMHTLKGNARIFNITSLQDVAHEVEDVFQALRDQEERCSDEQVATVAGQIATVAEVLDELETIGRRVVLGESAAEPHTAPAGSFVLRVSDAASSMHDDLVRFEDGSPQERDDFIGRVAAWQSQAEHFGLDALAAALAALAGGLAQDEPSMDALTPFVTTLGARCEEASEVLDDAKQRASADDGRVVSELGELLPSVLEALESVAKGGAKRAAERALYSFKAGARSGGLGALVTATERAEGAIDGKKPDANAVRDAATDLDSAVRLHVALLGDDRSSARREGGPTLRITERSILDVRREFKELGRALKQGKRGSHDAVAKAHRALGEAVQGLTQVPLSDLFERQKKMVFDLARQTGKRVHDLRIDGGDIRVDRKLLVKLRDVLMHALRNCIDHGIEGPEARAAAGKAERGTITIAARWEGESLVFDIEDDGAGFDLDRIREKALDRKLIDAAKLDTLDNREVAELAFLPGLSTSEQLTNVSGRGVGMDVIAATMRDLKGKANVDTERGRGTKLSLSVPADYHQAL